jgi:hypothetical protein
MNHVTEKFIEEAITTTDPDIIGISLLLDAKDEENSEGMCNIDHEAASPYTIHTVVLPKPSLIDANVNLAIMACWIYFNQRIMMSMKMKPMMRFYLMRNMPETDQLFQCHMNWMSQLLNGLTTKHYWPVPFQINFFLVKVFPMDCQLNEIGNIFLSIMIEFHPISAGLFETLNCANTFASSMRKHPLVMFL